MRILLKVRFFVCFSNTFAQKLLWSLTLTGIIASLGKGMRPAALSPAMSEIVEQNSLKSWQSSLEGKL